MTTLKDRLYSIPKAELAKIVKSSKFKKDLHLNLGIYSNGNTSKLVNDLLKYHNITFTKIQYNQKYIKILKVCPVCRTNFNVLEGEPKEKTTCSNSCSNTYFHSGYNNGNFKGNQYRTLCFAEHKRECVICKESLAVDVHHFDENRNNNSVENLVPLCPTHHRYWHSKHRHLVYDDIVLYIKNFTPISQSTRLCS